MIRIAQEGVVCQEWKEVKMETKFTYYLGLDMGTDSLGWAVTDSSYHILRAKGKGLCIRTLL